MTRYRYEIELELTKPVDTDELGEELLILILCQNIVEKRGELCLDHVKKARVGYREIEV